jgi:hypothetical protein
MSYITKSLVPGETLLFETRHHWVVLIGPVIVSLLLGVPGAMILADAVAEKNGRGVQQLNSIGPEALAAIGAALLLVALIIFAYGLAKRNATEMAVTNRRVLIKTGMASRRTGNLPRPDSRLRLRSRARHRRHPGIFRHDRPSPAVPPKRPTTNRRYVGAIGLIPLGLTSFFFTPPNL